MLSMAHMPDSIAPLMRSILTMACLGQIVASGQTLFYCFSHELSRTEEAA